MLKQAKAQTFWRRPDRDELAKQLHWAAATFRAWPSVFEPSLCNLAVAQLTKENVQSLANMQSFVHLFCPLQAFCYTIGCFYDIYDREKSV